MSKPPLEYTLFFLVGLLSACQPLGSYEGLPPDAPALPEPSLLVVYPTLIDFGTVRVTGESIARTLTFENPGDAWLQVYGHDQPVGLYGEDIRVFQFETEPILELAPGASRPIAVTFTPPEDGRWEAALLLEPGSQTVEVMGRGSAPAIGLDQPEDVVIPIGCEASVAADVYNQGSAPLDITGLELDDPWDAWSLAADPIPATVAPGQRIRVRFTFAPQYDGDTHGPRMATVTFRSNDPMSPTTSVALEGLAMQLEGVTERFTYRADNNVDLLVVADTDGVMGLRIPAVLEAMPALISQLSSAGALLHSAVVTGVSSCPQTVPAFADPSYDQQARVDLLTEGMNGSAGPGSDMLGEHAARALAETAPEDCLAGFLRPGARLHVLLVAGDEDQSNRTPETQLASIAAAANDASRVTVSSILPTDDIGCYGTVYSETYGRLAADSNGAVVDLCSDELTEAIGQVAVAAMTELEAALEHPLQYPPIAESIRVTVDGEPWTDYTYRASDQTLLFDATNPPPVGGAVEVTYRAMDAC